MEQIISPVLEMVAVLLPDAIEAAPSAVADEEPAQAVCDRVIEELGCLKHLSHVVSLCRFSSRVV